MSAIGFGAWEISIESEEVRAIEAIRAGVAAGMTWVNTAEMYGMGRGEEIVGLALADFPSVLAITKVWHGVNGPLTRDVVRAAAEASLKRLGRQAIDLYEVLEPDPALPLEEVWEAMAALVDAGLAHQIGVCNFSGEQVSRCERVRHVDAVENQFSLLHREEHEALREHCARAGVVFFVLVQDHTFAPERHRKIRRLGQSFVECHDCAVAMARLHQNKSHVAVCFWIVGLVSKNCFEGFDGFGKILFLECLFALIESRTNFR